VSPLVLTMPTDLLGQLRVESSAREIAKRLPGPHSIDKITWLGSCADGHRLVTNSSMPALILSRMPDPRGRKNRLLLPLQMCKSQSSQQRTPSAQKWQKPILANANIK